MLSKRDVKPEKNDLDIPQEHSPIVSPLTPMRAIERKSSHSSLDVKDLAAELSNKINDADKPPDVLINTESL